jgi:hypothetical protein
MAQGGNDVGLIRARRSDIDEVERSFEPWSVQKSRILSLWIFRSKVQLTESSGARESHPRALPKPDMNFSAHPAPIVQP